MTELTHQGWTLFTDEDRDGDGFIRYEHYAVRGKEMKHLHGSSFPTSFWPSQEIFEYLVDHDFPRAAKGNWYTHELEELIAKEKTSGETEVCEPQGASALVEGEDERDGVVRGLRDRPET